MYRKNWGRIWGAAAIFLCLLPFYLFRLAQPNIQIWDEAYYVPAAQSYLKGDPSAYRNPGHPPLGKEFIAVAIKVGGDEPFAQRFPSALLAAALGALLFLTAAWLSGWWESGLIATLLWLSSPLAYLHGRLAMLDMPTAFFYSAGLIAFLPLLKNPERPRRAYWIFLACFLAALGTAVKVIVAALFPLFFIGLLAVRAQFPLKKSLPFLVMASGATLAAVWMAVYGLIGIWPAEIPHQISRMIQMQSTPHKDYAGLSTWQDWFLGRGSLWFHSEKDSQGRRFAALCTNNPLLWIPGSLAALGSLWKGLRGSPVALYLGLAVPIQILFWVSLKSQWILSYGLPMEPVFCLATPFLLWSLLARKADGRKFAAIWGFCLAGAALFYFMKIHSQVLGYFQP